MSSDRNLKEFIRQRVSLVWQFNSKEYLALATNGRCFPGKSKKWVGYSMQWMIA